MTGDIAYPRGSEWRQWDLHVHSPASFHWQGEKFGKDPDRNRHLVDEMIGAMNEAEPAAFALMDYWTFDGWFKLKTRLAEADSPQLTKTVFPGIELRLAAPMDGRLNAHVVFSDKINDQYLRDFLSKIKLEISGRPLSDNSIIEYARSVGDDKLKKHGLNKAEINADDQAALYAGYIVAEVNCESYRTAISDVPNGLAVGFMPFSTNDGLASVKWEEHYAYALSLFQSSPIFETRDPDLWAAFANISTSKNQGWIDSFQAALSHVPRLAVSGSDAHKFHGTPGNNDDRGYGDYPSGKRTWIKADPSWSGLRQAIKEPAKRSFLGDVPEKLTKISQNKTFYIDALQVSKTAGSPLQETWLDGCRLPLNSDLVAIIGNKGSGKSALADIMALLGHSQQQQHFSFLKPNRFRGKAGEPARQFEGALHWKAGEPSIMLLCDDPSPDKVEMVRYIPQGRFEALCNDHVSGRSDAFEKELREVVFTHIDASVRLDALSFDELIDQQEQSFREKISELRQELSALNRQIVRTEDQLHPDVRNNLAEQLRLKKKELEEHLAVKPIVVEQPDGQITPEQEHAGQRLAAIEADLQTLDAAGKENSNARQAVAKKARAVKGIQERLDILEGQIAAFHTATSADFSELGLAPSSIVSVETHRPLLNELAAKYVAEDAALVEQVKTAEEVLSKLKDERATLTTTLNEPQQKYQNYVAALSEWQSARDRIEGTETEPESEKGIEARLAQLAALPAALAEKRESREKLVKGIYKVLSQQRSARAELFAPLQEVIKKNELIRDEYRLQFQANLQGSTESIATGLFDHIKKDVGELRGEDESYEAVRSRFEKYQFESEDDAVAFTSELNSLVQTAANQKRPDIPGIKVMLRKERSAEEVYDFIYGMRYIEPKYTLLFQDTKIEHLSPGQRGALLLIFYLLVDKGRNPIVLDQPEENLDNETVVSLLVPVLNEAKKARQIIMVTHNPNLAVVCDAEQIIHAKFDRQNNSTVTYCSGSIEDADINKAVVDILEGTWLAFNNRGQKYIAVNSRDIAE